MKKVMKKASAFIALAMMFVMMFAMSASAAVDIIKVDCTNPSPVNCVRYSESIIKTDEDTSLTLYKYNYSGEGNEGTGQYPGEIPEGAKPLEGVVFTYLKVADLVHINDEPMASLKYDLTNETIASVLGLSTGLNISDDLIESLRAVNEDPEKKAVLEKEVSDNGTDMEATDENGMAHAGNLPQGLYLVVETSVPGIVYERTNPFFVSLPMTNAGSVTNGNTTYEPGTLWQYDVFVFPKNKVDIPEIEKNILDKETGEREKYESAGVGDTVTYEVRSEVPLGVDTMSKYQILDTMSEGLTFTGIQKIRVGDIELSLDTVPVTEDYQVGDHTYTFMIDFIKDGRNLLAGHGGEDITVTYTAELNENCIVTEEGNPNHATMIYNHNAGIEESKDDMVVEDVVDPKVYTYGIDLEKVDKDGKALAGVEFELYASDKETQIYVTQKESTNTAYAGVNSYYPNGGNQGDKIVTDANGRAYIWGLAPGTYYLKETKTLEGYTLQKDLIEVKIGEEVTFDTANAEHPGTYVRIPNTNVPTYYRLKANGEYVEFKDLSGSAGKVVNFGVSAVYTKNADGSYTAVEMLYPVVKADVDVADPFSVKGMNVQLKVMNNPGFDIPLTGGIGTYIFTIGGAIIIFAALGLILIRRRKGLAR